MQRVARALRAFGIGLGCVLAVPAMAAAQGVTGAALQGTVTQEGGQPVEAAVVRVQNAATGEVYSTTTRSGGRYFIDFIAPGGPYTITVRAIGFQPQAREGIRFALGQRLTADFTLGAQVVTLQELVTEVRGDGSLINAGRTGNATTVSDSLVSRLPLQGRNFTDLIATNPQVAGTSIGGQNNRFNNIQIDGGVNNDLFGLAASGTPGGQSGVRPISVEAIKEFQVLIAPYDVRQGNFTGGLLNAITKSGTNTFHASLFGYYQGRKISGKRSDPGFADFNTYQYGGTISGPIIKDKLQFFGSVDIQQQSTPFGNQFQITGQNAAADSAIAGFSAAFAEQFQSILENQYGLKGVGSWRAPSLNQPDRNVFGKLNWQANERHKFEFTYNFVDGASETITRAPTSPSIPGRLRDGFSLSGSGHLFDTQTNTGRVKITSLFGNNISNEFLAGFSIIRDKRNPQFASAPLILVKAGTIGTANAWLAAGAERFSQRNVLDQDVFSVQNNTTIDLGKHRLSVGTSNEFFSFKNVFLQAADGVWAFNSLTDLQNGTAAAFQRRVAVTNTQAPGTAEFDVAQLGFYAQDEFQPTPRLTLTAGLRMDVPFMDKGNTNPAVAADPNFPINTGDIPDGNIQWSPRFGFNWDARGDLSTVVRGGVGIFSGRPVYVWYSNAYSINGLSQLEFTCTGANVPAFTPDVANAPTSCLNQPPPSPSGNQGEIDFFSSNIKNPQNLRVSLGVDHRLPFGFVGTVDLLYTKDVNQFYVSEENLVPGGVDGEGRTRYGTVVTRTGGGITATPQRRTNTFTQAVLTSNKSEGRVYSATVQLQKRFSDRFEFSGGYTFTDNEDLMSLTSSQALSNFQFAALDGTIADRNLRTSAFERRHNIALSGTVSLPYGFDLSLTYNARSGTPYTWMVNGDVNADGINGNDLPFIPRNQGDILLADPTQWAALDQFISSQECLNDHRGELLPRNSCRNPWQTFWNGRLQYHLTGFGNRSVALQLDVFNLANLIDSDKGLFREVSTFEQGGRFLDARGIDPATNKPIYRFTAPTVIERVVTTPTLSRWRMQWGARINW